jgi:transcriptional regulator GlxA family with amidase domain
MISLICGKVLLPTALYNCRKGQSFARKGQTAMPASATNEIGIVLYPGVQTACVDGLTDLFGIAASIALGQQRDNQSPPLRVTHWQAVNNRNATFSCVYDSDARGAPQPRILIIPPTLVDLPDPSVPSGVASWLLSQHAAGAKLERYGGLNGDFVPVCGGCHAALRPTAWTSASRSSMTR